MARLFALIDDARLFAVSEMPDAICQRVSLIWNFESRP